MQPDTFNVHDVIAIDTESGEVRLRFGDAAMERGFAGNAAFFSAGGFISAPNSPDSNGDCCQALYVKDGDEVYCIGTRDNRFASLVGSLGAGDCAIVSNCTSRFLLKREADTVSLYAENQKTSPAGGMMIVSLDATNGDLLIQNGGAFIHMVKDEINLTVNGGGSIRIHAGGVQIVGGDITLIGQVRAGDMGGGQPPLPTPVNAAAIGPGGPVNIVSTKVFFAN